jgi:fluoride exporter
MQWLMIALGGALGSVARFAAVNYVTSLFNNRFPMGTFVVNIVGSFLIGVACVLLVDKTIVSAEWRLFFITGILGGFTTFSAFSLDMLQLWQAGQVFSSIFYAASSVIFGLLFAYIGVQFAQKLF